MAEKEFAENFSVEHFFGQQYFRAKKFSAKSFSAENFVRSINEEEAPLNSPSQALALMKIIDATYESAKTGAPVSIS